MKNFGFPFKRHFLPTAIGCAGVVLAWLASEPSGLLVSAAGVSILGGRRASLSLAAVFVLALAAFILVAGWDSIVESQANLRLAVFLAVGLGVSGLVHLDQTASSSGREEREARLIVESMPGHGWSADPNGNFIYVSPSTLKYLGRPAENLDRIEGTDDFGWRQVVHPDDYDRVVANWRQCLKTGEPYENEHRIRRFDGTYRWFRNFGTPSRDSNDRITGWYGTSVDIEDRKTAEFAQRQSEQRLKQLTDTVPAMIWSTTPETWPTFVNKRFTDVTGATLEDINASVLSYLSVIHPDDRGAVKQEAARSYGTGVPYVTRFRLLRRDGSYRWTETRAEPLRDESGIILQWYCVSVDIDDEVTAQQALRDRERELSQLVNMIPSNVWRLTPDGKPTFLNKRTVDFFGLDVADMDKPGMSRLAALIETAVHPDDAAGFGDALRRCLATGESFAMRYRMRRADGVYRWLQGRAEPMRDEEGGILQWYGLSHDIDDQMHAEEALRRGERELQQLVDALPVHIWSWTPDGKLAYVNKRSLEELGLSGANFEDCTRVAQELVHPEDAPEVLRTSASCLKTGGAFMMRYRRRWKDGNYRWIEGRCEPLRDRDGTIARWYQVSIDIDDEMRAQEALRESERALRQLVETLPAMLYCAAPNGEPIYRSQQLCEFLGYELVELDGFGKSRLDGTLDAVHPDDVAGVKMQYGHSLLTGEPYARTCRLRRFDGEYRWVETRAAPMQNAEGAIVQWNVICLDIDREVRVQEELRLAHEMMARASQAASLAELSASIAHEVNQPLAAIVATSDACRRWLSADPPNLERAAITLERIIRDANSASEVVSRIRALFSETGRTRSLADITEVILEVCRLMANELAMMNIEVKNEFDGSLPPVLIDRVQMQQVLVNLIRNAVDALDTIVDGSRLIRLCAVLDGDDTIRVEVRDAGAGMKEPERVFEPFFTTKENGMGMGLTICRSIIESHDGRLWAISNQPRGTTLAFTLPTQSGGAA